MDDFIDKDMDNMYMKVELANDKVNIFGQNVTPNDFMILVSYVIKDVSNKTGVPYKSLIEIIEKAFDTGVFDDFKDLNEELN